MKVEMSVLVLVMIVLGYSAASPFPCPYYYNSSTELYYNLGPMQRNPGTSNYLFSDSQYNYEINICAPAYGTFCNPVGPACQFVLNSTGQYYNIGNLPLTLGPYPGNSDGITVIYFNGESSNTTNCSRVTNLFIQCNASAGQGNILNIEENPKCTYNVYMESAYACGQKSLPAAPSPANRTTAQCTKIDSQTGLLYDLNPLSLSTGAYFAQGVTYSNQAANYSFNICANTNKICGNSPSCQEVEGEFFYLGQLPPKLTITNGGVTLQYFNGQQCPSLSQYVSRSTIITLICDARVDFQLIGPVVEEPQCTYNIKAYSKYACGIIP